MVQTEKLKKRSYLTSYLVNIIYFIMSGLVFLAVMVFLESLFQYKPLPFIKLWPVAYMLYSVIFSLNFLHNIYNLSFLLLILWLLKTIFKKFIAQFKKSEAIIETLTNLHLTIKKIKFPGTDSFLSIKENKFIQTSVSLYFRLKSWYNLHKFYPFILKRVGGLWIFVTLYEFYQMIWLTQRMAGPLFFWVSAALAIFIFLLATERNIRYGFIALIIIFSGSLFAHWYGSAVTEGSSENIAKRPNILMLVSDTTRADHMSFNGYKRETTPNMKKLSNEGVHFKRAYSTSAWTKPATASLVTSRYLVNDGVHDGPSSIEWSGITMAQFFKRKGYDTSLVSANSNASSFFGHAKGYNYRIHSKSPDHSAFANFTVMKFYDDFFHGESSMELKNIELDLDDYLELLKLPSDKINDYLYGSWKSQLKLSADEESFVKNKIQGSINRKAAKEFINNPTMVPRQSSVEFAVISNLFSSITYFFFFTLENSYGEIADYWLKDYKVARSAKEWLQKHFSENKAAPRKPFFMHVQIMGPHSPYMTQPPYMFTYFDKGYSGKSMINPPTQHTPPSVPAPELKPRDLQNMIANYDDAIRITDFNLQEIVNFVHDSGELENTIIVFLADHGESFYDHFIYGHMNSLHKELIDIPLFFYWKNHLMPLETDRPAAITDVFPSLATLAGYGNDVKKIKYLQGESLFNENLQPLTDNRDGFQIEIGTVVGSAWKEKKEGFDPFGYHVGIINNQGKLIKEQEEIGTRFFYFPSNDKLEKRVKLDMKKNLSETNKNMVAKLPYAPDVPLKIKSDKKFKVQPENIGPLVPELKKSGKKNQKNELNKKKEKQ